MVEKSHTSGWWPSLYEPLRQFGERVADWVAPRSEAKARADAYEITVELPGVAQDDIDVALADGVLTVRGEKLAERSEEGEDYFFSEREYGRFQRSFRLPPDADGENVSAAFADGVLRITVPRRGEEETGARRIRVRAG
jgi:HSP20 family protein